MRNYLAIIRRADYIDLYKYGFFYLDKEKIVEIDCPISELPSRSDIFDSLFLRMNSFESSFAYLIVNYTKEDGTEDFSFVSIEELKHIFPLNQEAKREYESSFDEHTKIDDPIWGDAVSLMKKKQMFHSSMQGARNVFNIFKLKGWDKCKKIIKDDIVEKMLSDVDEGVRPQGELSLWVYLMRYERHSYYPKETLGYFMDIVHILVNFMSKKEEADSLVESTIIYNVLSNLERKDLKTKEIMQSLRADKAAAGFLDKVSSFVPEIDFITTAVNYLKLRDVYKDVFVYEKQFVEECKQYFGECFTLAAYMVGIAFGHDRTYSCLYEELPLAIYKSKEEMIVIRRRRQEKQKMAMREMERIERERKRNEAQKKGKKGQKKNPVRLATSDFESSSKGQYFNDDDSKSDDASNAIKQKDEDYMGQHQNSNFGQEEMREWNLSPDKSKKFKGPGIYQKYTKSGKKASKNKKPVTKELRSEEEYSNFIRERSEEDWRFEHEIQ